ncbi:MAG TPA: phosphohistidine phosphatase SixA [Bryobacteraceae bacterium]|nr:phosphohistidine phosphatase SixA [Bryobacteraceae bacterium]
MEIYLLRHGIAEDAAPGKPDADRALTAAGRQKLRRVLARARSAKVEPGVILSSPYRRALETAEVAGESLGYHGKVVPTAALTPDADPRDTWEEIRARKSEDSILLASHEPLMSTLLAFLLNTPALLVDFKKAALARVDCDRFGPEPHATLKWILTPATAGE